MACRVIIPNSGHNKGKETPSILFNHLLNVFNSDERKADEVYKKIFTDEFLDKFGDWMGTTAHITETDINGEPWYQALTQGGITDVEDYLEKFGGGLTEDFQNISDAQTIGEPAALRIVERLERVFGFKAKVIDRKDKKWAGKFVADVPIIM